MKINLKLFVNIYIKKDISNIYDMLSYLLLCNYVYVYFYMYTEDIYVHV